VRVVLQTLMQGQGVRSKGQEKQINGNGTITAAPSSNLHSPSSSPLVTCPLPLNLDEAYLSGVLQQLVDQSAGNVESVRTNSIPVINRVSAGYPRDFTDLSYPKGVADDYVGCPDVHCKDSFAARVHGDSMQPKYQEGNIIIFDPSVDPKDGDDCFVRFDDGHTTFKRVFFEKDEAGTQMIRLQPRNEKYRPQVVPAEQISGLYKAVYRYQRVDE
jgi:phage repressor protein C with HTH and peptisase S24 domain